MWLNVNKMWNSRYIIFFLIRIDYDYMIVFLNFIFSLIILLILFKRYSHLKQLNNLSKSRNRISAFMNFINFELNLLPLYIMSRVINIYKRKRFITERIEFKWPSGEYISWIALRNNITIVTLGFSVLRLSNGPKAVRVASGPR